MNNKGISLISLIITIIVIIILAAIVIFSGFSTMESASFARYTSEISDFQDAVNLEYMDQKQALSVKGRTMSAKKLYYGVATNNDFSTDISIERIYFIDNLKVTILPEGLKGTQFYEIPSAKNIKGWNKDKNFYDKNEKLYVTNEGEVFTLPGYPREIDGESRHYVNATKYYVGDAFLIEEGEGLGAGAYVKYESDKGDSATWRVWSMDGDSIYIMPTHGIDDSITLSGKDGYTDVASSTNQAARTTKLDLACKEYTSVKYGITEANIRSMRIEDIEMKVNKDALIKRKMESNYGKTNLELAEMGVLHKTEKFFGDDGYIAGEFYTYQKNGTTIQSSQGNSVDYPFVVQKTCYNYSNPEWLPVSDTETYGDVIGELWCFLASPAVELYDDGAGYFIFEVYKDYIEVADLVYSGRSEVRDVSRRILPYIQISLDQLKSIDGGGSDQPLELIEK